MLGFPHRRRFIQSGLAAAAAVLAAPYGHAQKKLETTRLVISVAGKAAFHQLPLTVAEQLGYFYAEGLEVEVVDHGSWTQAQQALLAGNAELCSGSFEQLMAPAARAQACQSIVLQGRTPQIAMGVSVRNMPNYRAVQDLRGRKIGISAPGSTNHLLASRVLAGAGLLAGDVNYISVGYAASALAALRSGQVDALSNSEPVMTMLELKADLKIIADTRSLQHSLAVFGGPMPASCLYAPKSFIERHPRTCQALAHAMVRSLKWLQTAGPSDMVRTVPEAFQLGDRALYLAAFSNVRSSYSSDGMLSTEAVRTSYKVTAEFEAAAKAQRLNLAALYTNEFARNAKERFHV